MQSSRITYAANTKQGDATQTGEGTDWLYMPMATVVYVHFTSLDYFSGNTFYRQQMIALHFMVAKAYIL